MVRKVLVVLLCISFVFSVNLAKTEAAEITTELGTVSIATGSGEWVSVFKKTAPKDSLFISLDYFHYSNDPTSWSYFKPGIVKAVSIDRTWDGSYITVESPVEIQVILDNEVVEHAILKTTSTGKAVDVEFTTNTIDRVFKAIEIKMKARIVKSENGTTWDGSIWFNQNPHYTGGLRLRHTDEATARILGTSISAEEARRAAQEAREKAQQALDKAEAARVQAVNAVNKAEQARLQALAATDKAEQARLQALAAAQKAEASRLQALEASERAEAARLQALAISNELKATQLSLEQKLLSNQTNLEKKINDLSESINTDIQNITTNIHTYLPPVLAKVSGANGATATKTSSIDIQLEYSNATQYRYKFNSGAWSDWYTIEPSFTVSGLSSGANTIYVEIRNGTNDELKTQGKVTVFRV